MTPTSDWQPFDGYYEKAMQDIILANGDMVIMCWPHMGVWMVTQKHGNEKYFGKDIPVRQAVKVRLTEQRWP